MEACQHQMHLLTTACRGTAAAVPGTRSSWTSMEDAGKGVAMSHTAGSALHHIRTDCQPDIHRIDAPSSLMPVETVEARVMKFMRLMTVVRRLATGTLMKILFTTLPISLGECHTLAFRA